MSPAAAAAHEAPPRTLESLLPSATGDEILGLVTPRKSSPRPTDASRNAGLPRREAGVSPASLTSPLPPRDSDADFFADISPASGVGLRNAGILPAGSDSSAASRNSDVIPTVPDPLAVTNPSSQAADVPAEISAEINAALDAHPDLRAAWQDARSYRETFASPEAAKEGAALLADLNRMDALFFSQRAEDHAELARSIADLDPAAFASLAQAIASVAADSPSSRAHLTSPLRASPASRHAASVSAPNPATTAAHHDASRRSSSAGAGLPPAPTAENPTNAAPTSPAPTQNPSPAQTEFFHATNAAAVEGVLEAIESQVERLLPDGIAKSARARVVGEIYRELDTTLRSNRQLSQQMRDAFRSGSLDTDQQRAIVSLVTGRARQALPAVAKRVLNEWTSTIVAANNDRRTRQRTAERRIDIAGSSGSSTGAGRSSSPREINYSRMSDSDILNM